MRIAFSTVVVLAVFPAEALAASAISSGTEVVGVGGGTFSPAAATGSWCVGAEVDGVANNGYAYTPGGGARDSVHLCFLHKERSQERSVLVLQVLRSEDLQRRRTTGADREVPGSRDGVW